MPYEGEFAHYKSLRRLAENEQIQALLRRSRISIKSGPAEPLNIISLSDLKPSGWLPDFVVAVDGSLEEVPVNNGYPCAAVGYVTVASVLLDVAKMLRLDASRPADPKEFRTIENAESIDSALPCSNVVIDNEQNATDSFRRALFELFQSKRMSEKGETILDTYEALLQYKPNQDTQKQTCPYSEVCLLSDKAYRRGHAEYICSCLLARSLFSTDALRIHESLNPEGSNQSVLTQTINVLERLWVIHFLRTLEQENLLPVLRRLAIVIDGPLAIFDDPAWLSSAIKLELARINNAAKQALNDNTFDILLFGIEKSGAFMEHLIVLDKGADGRMDAIPKQTAMLLTDNYIKKRIVFSDSERSYGRNTYFGRKFFYKAASGALIVVNAPFLKVEHQDVQRADLDQFPRLADIMSLLDTLVSARYRNSIIPLISAHAEAAIPLNLGKRILEDLARQLIAETP